MHKPYLLLFFGPRNFLSSFCNIKRYLKHVEHRNNAWKIKGYWYFIIPSLGTTDVRHKNLWIPSLYSFCIIYFSVCWYHIINVWIMIMNSRSHCQWAWNWKDDVIDQDGFRCPLIQGVFHSRMFSPFMRQFFKHQTFSSFKSNFITYFRHFRV